MATVCGTLGFAATRSCLERATDSAPQKPVGETRFAVRLMQLVGIPAKSTLQLMLRSHFRTTPDAAQDAAKVIMRSLQVLGSVGHQFSEISVYSVHAAAYFVAFVNTFENDGLPDMLVGEFVRVFSLCLYLAHLHVEDATFTLKEWHTQLFRDYCSLQVLNFSLMKLLGKLEFKLRIDESLLRDRLRFLQVGAEAKKMVQSHRTSF